MGNTRKISTEKSGAAPTETEYEDSPPAYSMIDPATSGLDSGPDYEVDTPLSSRGPLSESHLLSGLQSPQMPDRLPTRSSSNGHLLKPIAIPATTKKLGSAFLRAYPPSLESYHISRELFLRFLDDLNRVAVKSPPLQVLSAAGGIVGFVPLATAQIVSSAVQVASELGAAAVSKGRVEMELRQANKDIFSPRGLKCEIAKLDAVAKLAGIPVLNAAGKVDKNLSLFAALDEDVDYRDTRMQERRLRVLEPYIAHLDITPLPEIVIPDNPLSKLSASISERERRKGEEKSDKKRREALEKFREEQLKIDRDYEKDSLKLDEKARKLRSKDSRKAAEELEKIEKERRKLEEERDKEMRKITKDRVKDDSSEEGLRKILWLIIRSADADSGMGENPDFVG